MEPETGDSPSVLRKDALEEKVILDTVDGLGGKAERDAHGSIFSRSSASNGATVGVLSCAADSNEYSMKHGKRGKCIIVNNREFDAHTRLNERRGTEADARALHSCFRSLDFEVETLTNACATDIKQKLKAVSKEDHSDSDCLMICVMTHGELGSLWARDQRYPVDELFHPFKGDNCPSLAGKPKIFFIQACQGDKLDHGVTVARSGADVPDNATYYRIPTWADFLITYSTVPGFYSWRNTTNGSWFIQALTSVIEKNVKSMDLMSMMTLVNRKVAYEFESSVPNDQDFDRKKQVPCITSMLTRRISFSPKYQ